MIFGILINALAIIMLGVAATLGVIYLLNIRNVMDRSDDVYALEDKVDTHRKKP